jgi:hypothetical protein
VLSGYFARSCNFLNNSDESIVQDMDARKSLLYLATAHIAALTARGSGMVGTITSAGKGSVSTAFTGPQPGSGEWFQQTAYGYEFWTATAVYRSFIYV